MLDPKEKYVSLVTYRKNGEPVATPVWFADLGGSFGVITEANVGKVKRIRNNSKVSVTVCDVRGSITPLAQSIPASARLVTGHEAVAVRRAISRKYGIVYRLFATYWFVSEVIDKVRGRRADDEVAIVFTLDATGG